MINKSLSNGCSVEYVEKDKYIEVTVFNPNREIITQLKEEKNFIVDVSDMGKKAVKVTMCSYADDYTQDVYYNFEGKVINTSNYFFDLEECKLEESKNNL